MEQESLSPILQRSPAAEPGLAEAGRVGRPLQETQEMATREQQDDRMAPRPAATAFASVLGPEDRLPDKPFTDPEETRDDLLVMSRMLALEREIALTWGASVDGPGISEQTSAGGRRLLAVPDGRALLRARDVTAVGFFGRLREDVDHAVLFEHERRIARLFPRYAPLGFLSYLDVGPEHGRYGNLILFWTPDVPDAWHQGEAHRRAVADAPAHYLHIRLHKGRIPGPFTGAGEVQVLRTHYLDFAAGAPWRALRTYT
jgi:hypothetical protein